MPAPTLQWYLGDSGDDSQPIPSATGSGLPVSSDDGVRRYWVRASNVGGTVDSTTAVVTPWTKRKELGDLRSFQHIEGKFVVGVGTELLLSADGLEWSYQTLSTGFLGKLAKGNGLYVMGGFAGTGFAGPEGRQIYTSPDLANWTSRSLPAGFPNGALYETAYGNGRFVMGSSYRGGVFTSPDGINWTRTSLGSGEGEITVRAIIFDSGQFLAVGGERDNLGLTHGVILASNDGLSWVRRVSDLDPNDNTTELVKIIRAGSRLFALGRHAGTILSSTDGTAWSKLNLGGSAGTNILQSVVWLNGEFIVGTDSNRYFTSSDTQNWTEVDGPRSLSSFALVVQDGQLVAAGRGAIHTSVDAVNWFVRVGSPDIGTALNGVAYGSGRFVVSGFWGDDYSSMDGLVWEATETPVGQQSGGRLSFGNGVFICNDLSATATVWRSTDGRTWQSVQVSGVAQSAGAPSFANGMHFVPLGAGLYATSPDGLTWTIRTLDADETLQEVVFGNGHYVASVGRTTKVTADLLTWTESSQQSIWIYGLSHGHGLFVAVGGSSDGRILTSTDGLNWTSRLIQSSNGISDVVFDGDRFAVSTVDEILLSRDGLVWNRAALPGTHAVTTGRGSFMGVGQSIWQSVTGEVRAPAIEVQPAARTTVVGNTAAFTVGATGSNLSYQWRKGGNNLTNGGRVGGATSATLTIGTVEAGDAGNYDVIVSNSAGSVTSSAATLTVSAPPVVTAWPASRTVSAGGATSLAATVTGATSYVWKRNGSVITGATSGTLDLTNVTSADRGLYEVVATNAAGSVRSLVYVNVVQGGVEVRGWGDNSLGQRTIPAGLTSVAQVTAGVNHTVALKGDGTVVAWGDNSFGQTNVPAGLTNVVAIAAGTFHTVALKGDGTVVAWGRNDQGQGTVPSGLTNVAMIYAGGYHNLALKRDGSITGWGQNDVGQANVPSGLTDAIGLSAGTFHTVALKANGTVQAWGRNLEGQASVPAGLANVTALVAGSLHSVALKGDGTVVAWGSNAAGQTAVPSGLANVKSVSARTNHTAALKNDGTVVVWGSNSHGQANVPADLGSVTELVAGGNHNLALRISIAGFLATARLGPEAGMASWAPALSKPASGAADVNQNAVAADSERAASAPANTNEVDLVVESSGASVLEVSFQLEETVNIVLSAETEGIPPEIEVRRASNDALVIRGTGVIETSLDATVHHAVIAGSGGPAGTNRMAVSLVPNAPANAGLVRWVNLAMAGRTGGTLPGLAITFDVVGAEAVKVMIVGAGLADVAGEPALGDAAITLQDELGRQIGGNENWEAADSGPDLPGQLRGTNTLLSGLGDEDAALLLTLSPGRYTVKLTGTRPGTGLIEIHRL
jgi:alpha-tubulin suppressor-like RCC1 family protein